MKGLYLILILISLISCRQEKSNNSVLTNSKVIAINNSAVKLASTFDHQKVLEAIKLLDSAIAIQPDYITAYWNKIFYQNQIGLSIEALKTLQKLGEVNPKNPYIKMTEGAAIEFKGDTIAAKSKFMEAESLYLSILDTFKLKNNLLYESILINRAINLRFLRREAEGNKILNDLLNNEKNAQFKESIEIPISMSREELILFIWHRK